LPGTLPDKTPTIYLGSDQMRPTERESKEGNKAILMVFVRKEK